MWLAMASLLVAVIATSSLFATESSNFEINAGICRKVEAADTIQLNSLRFSPMAVEERVEFGKTLITIISGQQMKAAVGRDHAQHGLSYVGKLSPEGVARFELLLKENPDTQHLVVNSMGGDEKAAIALAETVAKRQLELRVIGTCASACANYLLPAAPRVLLEGVVAMHGSAPSCLNQLGTLNALWTLGFKGYATLVRAAKRDDAFTERFPALQRLVTLSGLPSRGDPTGKTHKWMLLAPAVLKRVLPNLTIGANYEKYQAVYLALHNQAPFGSVHWLVD
jgi:hypothetical protein